MSPSESEDLTAVVRPAWGVFCVFVSPEGAEHAPNYRMAAVFLTRSEAESLAFGRN
jgi:hypothetical protein